MIDTGIGTLIRRFQELSEPMEPEPTDTEPLLRKLEGIRFVVFDFYGTLFISGVGDIGIDESLGSQWIAGAMESCGMPNDPVTVKRTLEIYNETIERFRGELIAEGFELPEPDIRDVWLDVLHRLNREELLNVEPDTALARVFSVEYEARSNPVWPMPDLTATLPLLHEKNLPTGIISNSQFYTPIAWEALTGESLRQSGFHPGLLHWSWEEKWKKPSEELYRGFLARLERHFPGSEPYSVLFVGNDMLKDIRPASAVGMKTALFAGDKRSLKLHEEDPRSREVQPDLVITELGQLPECV